MRSAERRAIASTVRSTGPKSVLNALRLRRPAMRTGTREIGRVTAARPYPR